MGAGKTEFLENGYPEKFSVAAEKCCGCLQCMMACTLTWGKSEQLTSSKIKISRDAAVPYRFEISIDRSCRAGCKLCAKWCPYDALTLKEGQV